jgi:serine/threonine protein kinase
VLVRDEPRAKERFTREAKLLSELKSKSFPQFYSYGEANGCPYLAMELLEPGDLPAGDRNVARFLLSVCDAVAELHSRGYIHRDIKPGNILWRRGRPATVDGRARSPVSPERSEPRKRWLQGCAPHPVACPVLTDLGLAKKIETSNYPTTKLPNHLTTIGVGTPGYGAPEQMERGEATVASDIHALGVLADQCFGGKPPRTWARIIRRATSSVPAHRYPSVAAFARAIHRRHFITAFGLLVALSFAVCVVAVCVSLPRFLERPAERCLDDDETPRWDALCSRGEIVSIEERNDPIYPDRPYPAVVRRMTNRVEGVVVQLGAKTNVFGKPIRLNLGEYRIVGPGRLDADLSGPSNVVVRLKDCILNNMTEVPYPQNGIRYVLEGGVYLNFARLDKGILPIKHVVIEDGAENAVRFRGPTIISELRDLQWLEEKRSWEDSQRQIP